jgi:hypothetical protein
MKNVRNAIVVNRAKKVIEITKAFDKASSYFGSEEYEMRKRVLDENPGFSIVIKGSSKRTLEEKITLKDIYYYVNKKSGEDSAEMRELKELNGTKTKDAKDMFDVVETANFHKIKEWFFCTYPEVGNRTENRTKRINEILANAVKRAEERAEAANIAVSA